jgi:hypothetical protein
VLDTYAVENVNLNNASTRAHFGVGVLGFGWPPDGSRYHSCLARTSWIYFILDTLAPTVVLLRCYYFDQDSDHEAINHNTVLFVDISGEP